MIVDFHTHVFPDKLAEKAIRALTEKSEIRPYIKSTLDGLRVSMEEAGIDYSLALPVITDPRHFESTNAFAVQLNDLNGIVSFGGIHPDSSDYKKELRTIKELGLKGVKLHPEWQGVALDDIRNMRIVEYATELGLWVITHTGTDLSFPDAMKSTPVRVVELLKNVPSDRLILAHLGGWGYWDDIEEMILGRDIYLDIAHCIGEILDERLVAMINAHGADKILFATDSPWGSQKEYVEALNKMDLTEEQRMQIFGKNAAAILGL